MSSISIGRSEQLDKYGNYNSEIDEIRAEDSGYLLTTGTDSTLVYDTPSSCKAHLRTLLIYNGESSANTYTFTDGDGGTTKLVVVVGATTQVNITNIHGFVFSDDIYMTCSVYASGSNISVGVIVENNEIIE